MLDLCQGLAPWIRAENVVTIDTPAGRTCRVKILLVALSSMVFILQKRQEVFVFSPPGSARCEPTKARKLMQCTAGWAIDLWLPGRTAAGQRPALTRIPGLTSEAGLPCGLRPPTAARGPRRAGPAGAGRLPWGRRADMLVPAGTKHGGSSGGAGCWQGPPRLSLRRRGCRQPWHPRQRDFERARPRPGTSRAQAHRAACAAGRRGGGTPPPRSCASALTPAAREGGQAPRAASRRRDNAAAGPPPRSAGAAQARARAGHGLPADPAHCSSHKP